MHLHLTYLMNCLSCQKEIPTKLGYVNNCSRYCQGCFAHIIEKRVRKYVKEHHKLKRGQRVVARDAISRFFLEHVVHVPLTLIRKATKKTDAFVPLRTMDDAIVVFLEHFFFGKKREKKKSKDIFFFTAITDEELALYCKYKGICFTPKKQRLKEYIYSAEKEHPGTLHALYKSCTDLEDIF